MRESFIALALAFLVALAIIVAPVSNNSSSQQGDAVVHYKGRVCVTKITKDGEVIDLGCHDNVLTDAGKNLIKNLLGNTGSGGPVQYIALSDNATHVPSASDTSLPGEITSGGLERAQGTFVDGGTGTWNITHTFTATTSFTGVRLAGLFNQSSGGTMLAENNFTAVNLESGDQLTITWQITVS